MSVTSVVERVLHPVGLAETRSDKALVRAAQHGDARASAALVERYYPRVHRFVRNMTHHSEPADDLTQEVFARALKALPTFNGQYKIEHWLLKIAKNLCIDEARRDVHRPEPVDPHELPESEMLVGRDFVWESVSRQMAAETVHKALSHLPARQRTVLALRELEGMSYADIAELVGTNVRGVEATLRRARVRFRFEAAMADRNTKIRPECLAALKIVATDPESAMTHSQVSSHMAECWECRSRVQPMASADRLLGIAAAVPLAAGAGSGSKGFLLGKLARAFRAWIGPGATAPAVAVTATVTVVASVAGAAALTRLVSPPSTPAAQRASAAASGIGTGSDAALSVPEQIRLSRLRGGAVGAGRGGTSSPASSASYQDPNSPEAAALFSLPIDLPDLRDPRLVQTTLTRVGNTVTRTTQFVTQTVTSATSGVDTPAVPNTSGVTSKVPASSLPAAPKY